MARILIGPEGEKIELDGPTPTIEELCELILRPIAEKRDLPIEFLKNGDISEVRKALNFSNDPLIMDYKGLGYPKSNRYFSDEDEKKLKKRVKQIFDSVD